jgi:hypothetical protein
MKSKKTGIKEKSKTRGLFDHINHIRESKNVDYYQNLTDEEKKSFNKYMILRFLSMDKSIIEEMAFISKYFQVLPEEQFYQLMREVVPRGRKFCKYIKPSKSPINNTILECLCKKYEVGEKDASDYYSIYLSMGEKGLQELVELIGGFGYSEKEIKKFFKE